jgi:hypothetical protein
MHKANEKLEQVFGLALMELPSAAAKKKGGDDRDGPTSI